MPGMIAMSGGLPPVMRDCRVVEYVWRSASYLTPQPVFAVKSARTFLKASSSLPPHRDRTLISPAAPLVTGPPLAPPLSLAPGSDAAGALLLPPPPPLHAAAMNAAESRMAGNRSVLVIDSSSETDTVCPPGRAFAHAIDGDIAGPLALSSAGLDPADRASVDIRWAPTASGSRPEPLVVRAPRCSTPKSCHEGSVGSNLLSTFQARDNA